MYCCGIDKICHYQLCQPCKKDTLIIHESHHLSSERIKRAIKHSACHT